MLFRSKLGDVQSSLLRVKRELLKAEEKRQKTKADFTRIARLTEERDVLQTRKNNLTASIPARQQPQPTSIVQLPPPFYNPALLGREVPLVNEVAVTRHVQPFPMDSNVKLESHTVKMEVQDFPDGFPGDKGFGGAAGVPFRAFAGPVGKADE